MSGKAKRTRPLRNQDIRAAIEGAGLCYWWVADELDIAHGTLSNWLRKELPTEKKQEILTAIQRLEDRFSAPATHPACHDLMLETRASISGRGW